MSTTSSWKTFTLALALFAPLVLVANGATAQQSRVFVTSTAHTGDLKSEGAAACGGSCATALEGADAICNDLASSASLGGEWVAWLSINSTPNAKDRLAPGSGPFVRATETGTVIANDIAGLTSGNLLASISLTELGVAASAFVMTGTAADGLGTSQNCNGWAFTTGGFRHRGGSSATNGAWTFDTGFPGCGSADHRLYCFEIPATPTPAASKPSLGLLAGLMAILLAVGFLIQRRRMGTSAAI